MSGQRVLVTGADGFIGSHLTEHLVRQGHRVRAFVYYNSFNSWGWLDSVPEDIRQELDVFAGDIRDPNGVRKAMEGIDTAFHLAALVAIPYSYHSPHTYVETNVLGTLNVVQAARDLDVGRVVHTSTSEVYGTAQFVPIDEKHPLNGQSPYSASKIGADQIAFSYHASFGTPVAIVRPFNTYGPRQSARAFLPTVITQIASGAEQVKLGSLEPTRDFSFVADTVHGFSAVAAAEEAVGQVVNLGSNFEISMGDSARLIAEIMGKDVEFVTDEQRVRPQASEVERLWADNSKAKAIAGWEPEYAGIDGFRGGLQQTIDWFGEPSNLQRYKADVYNL